MSNALATIQNQIYAIKNSFEQVAVDRSVNFEREAGFAIQSITANDYATKIAQQNPQSVINAVTNIAAIGISLNPAKKQAYLVPRKGGICLDISYIGLMDLAIDSGSIRWGQAKIVHANDTFALNGLDKQPLHQYSPFSKARGEIVGVYVTVKTFDGEYLTETMSIEDVFAIRDRSEAWKSYVKDGRTCPWVTDASEMIKKTVVKRGSKYWPKTERLDKAIHYLNTDGGEGIELTGQNAPQKCPQDMLDAWIHKAKAATTEQELAAVWGGGAAAIRPYKDGAAFESFKGVIGERRKEFAAAAAPIEGTAERVTEDGEQ
jgi:recombination protein RecT